MEQFLVVVVTQVTLHSVVLFFFLNFNLHMSGRGRPTGLRFQGNSEVFQRHQPRADFEEKPQDKFTLAYGEQLFVKAVNFTTFFE